MKPSEEKMTAWIDGELNPQEQAALEAEMVDFPSAQKEKEAAIKIGQLLREHIVAPELHNADFFNHQLMQRIEQDRRDSEEPSAVPDKPAMMWPLSRLIWAGAFCLLVAGLLFKALIPVGPHHQKSESQYLAEILNAQPGDASISATVVQAEDKHMTVLWLEGLDYLPDTGTTQ